MIKLQRFLNFAGPFVFAQYLQCFFLLHINNWKPQCSLLEAPMLCTYASLTSNAKPFLILNILLRWKKAIFMIQYFSSVIDESSHQLLEIKRSKRISSINYKGYQKKN